MVDVLHRCTVHKLLSGADRLAAQIVGVRGTNCAGGAVVRHHTCRQLNTALESCHRACSTGVPCRARLVSVSSISSLAGGEPIVCSYWHGRCGEQA